MPMAASNSMCTFHPIIRRRRCLSTFKRQDVIRFVSIRIYIMTEKFVWVCWIRGTVNRRSNGILVYPLVYRWSWWNLLEILFRQACDLLEMKFCIRFWIYCLTRVLMECSFLNFDFFVTFCTKGPMSYEHWHVQYEILGDLFNIFPF